jgi:hypothetical protein
VLAVTIRQWLVKRPTIKPEDVSEFWQAMQARYRTSVLDKSVDEDARLIAKFLDAMGIMSGNTWLENYCSTIGNRIWIPFTPGVPHGAWDLWQQVAVCVHEHYHVGQDRSMDGLLFEYSYASNSTTRAYYEAEAYRVNMTLDWRYMGNVLDPAYLASLLKAYNCNEGDIRMVEKMLRVSLVAIKRGAIPGTITQFACNWLDARWGRSGR